jgi:organic hydroperoxide reductase OsmC/OhrA
MTGKSHTYNVQIDWVGNLGEGTKRYAGYSRDHVIRAAGKPDIAGSADPAFRGDPARWNPEELLVAAVAACHKLWYLHLCATAGVVVLEYADMATGTMTENIDGSGQFTQVTLSPRVTISHASDAKMALHLHHEVSEKCYITLSVNFPVHHAPEIIRAKV